MGEAGTPRGQLSAGAQVSAGRAPRWGDWPSLLSLWGDGSSPSSASWHRRQRAAFPPGARARLRASSSGTASQLPGARSRRGGEEHVSSVAQPLTGRWQGSWVCQEESGERRWHFLGTSLWASPGSSPAPGGRCQAGSHLPRSTAGACGVLVGGLDLRREGVRAEQKGRHR